jgi:hypothetical protein
MWSLLSASIAIIRATSFSGTHGLHYSRLAHGRVFISAWHHISCSTRQSASFARLSGDCYSIRAWVSLAGIFQINHQCFRTVFPSLSLPFRDLFHIVGVTR